MKVRKNVRVTGNGIVDIKCDVCKKSTKEKVSDDFNYAVLREEFGYGSEFDDMTVHEFHLCETCYKKVLKYLKLKREV